VALAPGDVGKVLPTYGGRGSYGGRGGRAARLCRRKPWGQLRMV